MRRILLFLAVLIFFSGSVSAYEMIGSHMDRYYSLLALQGLIEDPSLNISSYSFNAWEDQNITGDHPWEDHAAGKQNLLGPESSASVVLLDTRVDLGYNSAFPFGMNDGPRWQGRGLNTQVSSGIAAEYGGLSAVAAPLVWTAQNQDFELMDPTEYGKVASGMDLPQRFGEEPIYALSAGESEVRYDYRQLTIGFGNQSLWLGPGYRNALLLSSNPGGFPKVDLGVRKTQTPIGSFEGMFWWGRLTQSDQFPDPENTSRESPHNLLTAMSVSYAPVYIPGFTLGVNRVAFSKWEDTNMNLLTEMFNPFMSPRLGQDESGQHASITLDWTFAEVSFNIYGEWARNDYSPGIRDNIQLAPGHSQGFTIGGRQVLDGRGGFFVIQGELTELINTRTYEINGIGTNIFGGQSGFYSHGKVRQGHTHRGQILGAGIGSGSDSQYLGVDYYHSRGMVGGYFQRIGFNKDYLYGEYNLDKKDPDDPYLLRLNVGMLMGVKVLHLTENGRIGLDTGFLYNLNRNFIRDNDVVNYFITANVTF